MKKIFFILGLLIFSGITVMAQDGGINDNDKMQGKMKEYLQKRLGLTKNEAEKFGPVFGRYLVELRKSHHDFSDPLIRQQRIAELRVRFRDEFKPILGEQRAGKVFVAEQEFLQRATEILNNRRERLDDNRLRKN
jgi:hypothetical protein